MIHLRGIAGAWAIVAMGGAAAEPVLTAVGQPEVQLVAIDGFGLNDADRVLRRNQFTASVQSAIIN